MTNIKVNNNQYDKEYLKGCAESSKRDDKMHGNGDGKLSAAEFQASFTSLNASVFANNDSIKSYADDLVNSNKSLFEAYAGDDGVLDANEKANLLNSNEYNKFITQWRQLSNEMEQQNNDTQTFLDSVDRFGNNDGKATVEEYLEHELLVYENVFKNNKDLLESAKEIAYESYEQMKKYAGDDGIISIKESMNHLDSEEYGKSLDKYWQLRDEQDRRTILNTITNPYQRLFELFKQALGLD